MITIASTILEDRTLMQERLAVYVEAGGREDLERFKAARLGEWRA